MSAPESEPSAVEEQFRQDKVGIEIKAKNDLTRNSRDLFSPNNRVDHEKFGEDNRTRQRGEESWEL